MVESARLGKPLETAAGACPLHHGRTLRFGPSPGHIDWAIPPEDCMWAD
jgi:hypothetical protein